MNTKRLLISIFSCFAFVFVYEFVFHGILLKSMYQATIEAWRPESEMMQYMPFAAFSQFWFATTFCLIFVKFCSNKSLQTGIQFGLFMGLFAGAIQFGYYPYMPITLSLALAWAVGSLVEGACLGFILAKAYKN
jgi:hypothetical protein